MSKIFLNQDELETKIDNFLSRKNQAFKTKKLKDNRKHAFRSIRMDVRRDRAMIAM